MFPYMVFFSFYEFFLFFFKIVSIDFIFFILSWLKILLLRFFSLKHCGLLQCFSTWIFPKLSLSNCFLKYWADWEFSFYFPHMFFFLIFFSFFVFFFSKLSFFIIIFVFFFFRIDFVNVFFNIELVENLAL
jgi:hypothetical protein